MALEAIKKLRDDGIEPSLDEIIWLHNLAKKSEKYSDPKLLLFSKKKIGNIDIYPMTMGAKVWLFTVAYKWFENDDMLIGIAQAYAYSHSRYPSSFEFSTAKECRKVLLKWASKQSVSEEEIIKANDDNEEDLEDVTYEYMLNDLIARIKKDPSNIDLSSIQRKIIYREEKENNSENNMPFIPYMAMLSHYYPNKTFNEWLWETPEELCLEMLIKMIDMEKVEEDKVDLNDPSILAGIEFTRAVNFIRKRNG